MIYAKVDVKLRDHVRAQKAGPAMSTWLWALLYVREQETDGFIPVEALERSWVPKEALAHAKKLVAVGLWEVDDNEDGYRICRYSAKNETKEVISSRRAEARDRMMRVRDPAKRSQPVRANEQRTNSEPQDLSSMFVPGSDSGSGSGSDLGSREGVQGETRPRVELPNPADPEPPWWPDVLETIAGGTEVRLPAREAWLRYAGHRHNKRFPATREDAVHWLTAVMVKEAREAREKARHQADRDAKWDSERAKQRAGPNSTEPQKLTDAEQRQFAEQLRQRMARKGAA